jgi:hypothetical protein
MMSRIYETIEVWEIKWDTRGIERGIKNRILLDIDLFVDTDDDNKLEEQISEFLTDEFGCCHSGFRWERSHKGLTH